MIPPSCTEECLEIQITSGFDNCDGPTGFFNETFNDGECAGSYEILRTWLMQDCSGNEQMHNRSSSRTSCRSSPLCRKTVNHAEEPTPMKRSTIATTSRLWRPVIRCMQIPGNYEHLVTLTASDSCGNSQDTTFMISVLDTEAPMWTNDEFSNRIDRILRRNPHAVGIRCA